MARLQTREDGDTGLLIHIGVSGKKSLKELAKKRKHKNPKQFAESIIKGTISKAIKYGEIKNPKLKSREKSPNKPQK